MTTPPRAGTRRAWPTLPAGTITITVKGATLTGTPAQLRCMTGVQYQSGAGQPVVSISAADIDAALKKMGL